MDTRLSTSRYMFIWFGAAISLAEIMTGAFFAPLGFTDGLLAIVLGHVIGGILFWLIAYVSARTRKSAMGSSRIAFGKRGSWIFSLCNVAQLVGWTSIMILSGATAAVVLVPAIGYAGWCVVIGAMIVVWIAIGLRRSSVLQAIACVLLLVLTVAISTLVFGDMSFVAQAGYESGISFGAAVELAVAMPLSWLPVVGDYTARAKKPIAATSVAAISYFFGSCWMFILGLGAALFLGSDNVIVAIASAGLGVVGLLVVVFSTVTTTYLDAISAGISFSNIFTKVNAKHIGVLAAIVGTVFAVFLPMTRFEPFLYLIGSVFAPMVALVIVNHYVLKKDSSDRLISWSNLVLWAGGFILYRFSMGWDFMLGNTIIVMVAVGVASIIFHTAQKRVRQHSARNRSLAQSAEENIYE